MTTDIVHSKPYRRLGATLRSPLALLLLWTERVRQRQALADLGDHQLRDIGLIRMEIEHEVGKPFWRG